MCSRWTGRGAALGTRGQVRQHAPLVTDGKKKGSQEGRGHGGDVAARSATTARHGFPWRRTQRREPGRGAPCQKGPWALNPHVDKKKPLATWFQPLK